MDGNCLGKNNPDAICDCELCLVSWYMAKSEVMSLPTLQINSSSVAWKNSLTLKGKRRS